MRPTACAILALSAAFAAGQSGLIPPTLGASIGAGLRNNVKNPLELQGFPHDESRSGRLPAPQTPRNGQLQIIKGTLETKDQNIILSGGTEVLIDGYRIFADRVEGNRNSKIFYFTGNVRLFGKSEKIEADAVFVEFQAGYYRATSVDSDLQPSRFGGYVLSDVYVKGKESRGTKNEIVTDQSIVTTCEYLDPHYEILAQRTVLRPYRRIVFHRVSLIVKHRKILQLPYFAIPLNEKDPSYLPTVGENNIEGYFVRSKWGIATPQDRTALDARLNYFTKLGSGIGADYGFGSRLQDKLSLYGLPSGPRTVELGASFDEKFGKNSFEFSSSYEGHNYLIDPNQTSLLTRAALGIPKGGGTTRLTYNRSDTHNGDFDSISQSIGLGDTRALSRALKSSVQLNWSRYDTIYPGTDIARSQLDVNTSVADDLKKAVAQVDYQRSIPIGNTNSFYNTSDVTPALSLKSDNLRLRAAKWLPFTAELATGQYVDPSMNGHIERTIFDFIFNKPSQTNGRSSIMTNGRFRQSLYSDDTAQYIGAFGAQYAYAFAKSSVARFNFNFQRPEGYAPLSVDRVGRTDVATGDVSYLVGHATTVGLQTGYDFEQLRSQNIPWQSLGVRADYLPTKDFTIRTVSTYDTYQKGWSNFRADISARRGPTFAALGLRYDAQRETLGAANLYLTALRYGKISADVRLQYNGYTKGFDAQQYGFVYDLHDAEAILQVTDSGYAYGSGRQIQFFLRLKAFPFNSLFGAGKNGQPVGVGTGRDF